MRTLVAFALSGLSLGPAARRAVDETLLDWGHEADAASGSRALARGLQALVAIGRVLVESTVRETIAVPWLWLCGRVALVAVLPAIVLVLILAIRTPIAPLAAVVVTPAWMMLLLPWAFFAAAAWPGRRLLPTLGVATVAFVTTFLIVGWMEPIGTQEFRELTYRQYSTAPAENSVRLPHGTNELTFVELTNQAWRQPRIATASVPILLARATWFMRLALMLMAPALVLLASASRGLSIWVRRVMLTMAPVSLAASIALYFAAQFWLAPVSDTLVALGPGYFVCVTACLWGLLAFLLERRIAVAAVA